MSISQHLTIMDEHFPKSGIELSYHICIRYPVYILDIKFLSIPIIFVFITFKFAYVQIFK